VKGGTELFEKYAHVDEKMLHYRKIAIQHKLPRRLDLFNDLKKTAEGKVEGVKFTEDFEGIIRSSIYHYQNNYQDVYPIWAQYKDHFQP